MSLNADFDQLDEPFVFIITILSPNAKTRRRPEYVLRNFGLAFRCEDIFAGYVWLWRCESRLVMRMDSNDLRV